MPKLTVFNLGRMRSRLIALVLVLAAALAAAAPADARHRQTRKKAIWGPVRIDGRSQFPLYRDLGVGIFQIFLRWNHVATARPVQPDNPADPAYRWPAEIDDAVAQARRNRMRVSVLIMGTPRWANGDRSFRWVPHDPRDFAAFATAAARRYPGVGLWQIWGEPTRRANFRPLDNVRPGLTLTEEEREGPRNYALLLDHAYVALKRVRRSNLVIGGSTYTLGDVSTFQWVRYMRLPDGRRPRMDLYAHNPFSLRRPYMRNPPSPRYSVDFSDLGRLAAWLDRWIRRPDGKPLPLFLSEFTLPTAPDTRFNFHVTRAVQADWVAAAIGIARGWSRIYTFGYETFRDDPAAGHNSGLLDGRGRKKPAYFAFRRG
jgi:hypothetical protein